ncbi:YdcH family protein [Photobacterium kishitanii]|uniref:YdcH family protein n=2 Tax=Photobacterium kishitanii TaxID=318456 RepID=UPI0007F8C0DC|nr:hypothetical protein [Photobacterium kishitanii]OBU32050.1 hypothetical protein AYY23_02720 [Photobacterium kishitanii]
MFYEHNDTFKKLKKENCHFYKLFIQYNVLDKAILKLENNFNDILELKQIQLDLKYKMFSIIKDEEEYNLQKNEKPLSMINTCSDWNNIEQDDFAN